MLLSRKRVNKGMKRINSEPLSPVIIFYGTLQRKPLPKCPVYVLNNTATLNWYLGLFTLFWFTFNPLQKHFVRNPKIQSNR